MQKPAEIRNHHYPPLSALTKKTIGKPAPSLDEELATVREIIEHYERHDWRELSQDDYDTLYPELTAYVADLQSRIK